MNNLTTQYADANMVIHIKVNREHLNKIIKKKPIFQQSICKIERNTINPHHVKMTSSVSQKTRTKKELHMRSLLSIATPLITVQSPIFEHTKMSLHKIYEYYEI